MPCTCRSLAVHFRFTSSSHGSHRWSYQVSHNSIFLNFAKLADISTDGKKWHLKIPFLCMLAARNLITDKNIFPSYFVPQGNTELHKLLIKTIWASYAKQNKLRKGSCPQWPLGTIPKTYSYISVYLEIFYHLPNISVKQMQTHSYRLNLSDFVDI